MGVIMAVLGSAQAPPRGDNLPATSESAQVAETLAGFPRAATTPVVLLATGSGMLSQEAIVLARGVSFASAGIQPSYFCRAKTRSRYLSQPSSNVPLYLSANSGNTLCGPCTAPGAQYIRNGLSGEKA